jgi:hypothetical protein
VRRFERAAGPFIASEVHELPCALLHFAILVVLVVRVVEAARGVVRSPLVQVRYHLHLFRVYNSTHAPHGNEVARMKKKEKKK